MAEVGVIRYRACSAITVAITPVRPLVCLLITNCAQNLLLMNLHEIQVSPVIGFTKWSSRSRF